MEEWKDIKNFEGYYQVSNMGNVKSLPRKYSPREIIMPGTVGDNGYKVVTLRKNGEKYCKAIHKLVGIYFVDNPNKLPCLNHKNGIKTDCRACNLEWTTFSENDLHAVKMGLRNPAKGTSHGNSKLSEEDVWDIRNTDNLGCFTQKEIADAYGVSQPTIYRIINKRTWIHI